MKHYVKILILLILGCSFQRTKQDLLFGQDNLDSLKYKNYLYSIDNESTFQYFLVIKFKDLNTNQTREICTKGDFLEGALQREHKLDYDKEGQKIINQIQRDNKSRYFEFKDKSAIDNLGVDNYSMDDYAKFEKTHNIDSLALILNKGKWSMRITDDKTMLLYAHALYNRGILTGENNCFGGTLEYIDEKWILKERKQIEEMNKTMNKIVNENN